ncbi:hypothetical protein ACFXAW_09935 [Streptomyces sp. NPDC059445]|uniref:hypothetical protein n=1 Tax=Streptomyces sp. NPDC059445 TaxID=3346832 RepID=UPI0036B30D12
MDALSRREFLEWAMAESVPVRCPACRREHLYAAPSYPCVCGSPVTAPLDHLTEATPVTHRAWDEEWTTVRCGACGRGSQWPQPELGCPCGTTLRIPLRTDPARKPDPATPRTEHGAAGTGTHRETGTATPRETESGAHRDGEGGVRDSGDGTRRGRNAGDGVAEGGGPEEGSDGGRRAGPGHPGHDGSGHDGSGHDAGTGRRPTFRPVAIRTARDAVTAAALYLGWLGYRDIRRADQRPTSGIGLAARGVLAQVDPTVRPASLRDVECLWLTAMTESANCVFFSLAGYDEDARARADTLGVPLFVLDLTGTPQPVNSPAAELIAVPD